MLEKVQRRVIKLVRGFKECSYEEILRRLKSHRLEEPRLRRLIEIFNLLTGKENVNPDQCFNINLNNFRCHRKILNKQQCTKLYL